MIYVLKKICLAATAMGSGEVRENAGAVLHKICASCLDKYFGSKKGKWWSDTECILRAESKGFKNILAIKGERKYNL